MSRAFVREGEAADEPPDRPLSPHRNLVTSAGLAQLDAGLARSRARLAEALAGDDRPASAAARRDLRYWLARRASAELAGDGDPDGSGTIRFGSTVTIERVDGRRRTFRIVGEDEADPSRERLSYVAPLARAVLGRQAGEEADLDGETILVIGLGTSGAAG